MEPDVIEIPPPPSRPKRPKLNQVIRHEVIDVDDDEDDLDIMILDEKIDTKNKGKAIEVNAEVYDQTLVKDALANYSFYPPESPVPGSHKPIIRDGISSDLLDVSEYADFCFDDCMDFDEYAYLQAHFDNVDIPPGVEAPIPSLLDSVHKAKNTRSGSTSLNMRDQSNLNAPDSWASKNAERSKKLASVGNSAFQDAVDLGNASGVSVNPFWSQSRVHTVQSKKIQTAPQHGVSTANPTTLKKRTPVISRSSTNYKLASQLQKLPISFHNGPLYGKEYSALPMKNIGSKSNLLLPNFPAKLDNIMGSSVSYYESKLNASIADNSSYTESYDPFHVAHDLPESVARSPKNVNEDDILRNYQTFKQFDTVEDHADHHYARNVSSAKQPLKNWAKRIQEEWRILEKDLPDNIYVRVYESRMDLLRAVIVGAEGTPYHDGLFFFDVFFPSSYPCVPPNVYYHSGGLRLNPNLYNCGKVCLSLLGTWHGSKNEKWQPGVSTVLQVLVSIQALILNQKPYFNEPGFARMDGSAVGEKRSQEYNEKTFMLSLKTMVYTMRRAPKHFEDFVLGHFHKYARDILVACKAYMDGAPVGCLVKGGVQDVDEGERSCSKGFKNSLQPHVDLLVKELSLIGVKNCEEFQSLAKRGSNQGQNMPTSAI